MQGEKRKKTSVKRSYSKGCEVSKGGTQPKDENEKDLF